MDFRLKSALRRLWTRENGDASVESMIVIPAVFFVFGAVWVWHDVGRQETLEQRINYSIGDMISRETDPLDAKYMDSTYELALAMLNSTPERSDVRVTIVKQTKNLKKGNMNYEVVWGEARGAREPLSGNLNHMSDRLPIMAKNDQVIVVETWRDYTPIFDAGLLPYEIESYSFTRPRFTTQVLFDDGATENNGQNNGWGNGDQDAPGGSLCNNNAENWDEGNAAEECADNADGSSNNERPGNSNKNKNKWDV